MPRFSNGWIKLPRQVLFGPVGKNANTLSVFVTLMGWANIQDSPQTRLGIETLVARGQVLTSACELACHLDLNRRTILFHLKKLSEKGEIEQQVHNRGRLITVCHYDEYQTDENSILLCSAQQGAHQSAQQTAHILKKNKKREEEKKISPNGDRERPGRSLTPHQGLVDIWNSNRGSLALVEKLTKSRMDKIRSRWAEKPDLEYWGAVTKRMAASRFCREGGWATFDWLIKNDTNHIKVSEGKYDNRDPSDSDASADFDWEKVFKGSGK